MPFDAYPMLSKFRTAIEAAASELNNDLNQQIDEAIEEELQKLNGMVYITEDEDLILCSMNGLADEYGRLALQDAICDELLTHTDRDPSDIKSPYPKPLRDAIERIQGHIKAIVKEMLDCRAALERENDQ
jgi:hypothetical protein